jgi:hypothetical protein
MKCAPHADSFDPLFDAFEASIDWRLNFLFEAKQIAYHALSYTVDLPFDNSIVPSIVASVFIFVYKNDAAIA